MCTFGVFSALAQLGFPGDLTGDTDYNRLFLCEEVPPEVTLAFVSEQPLVPFLQFPSLLLHEAHLGKQFTFRRGH